MAATWNPLGIEPIEHPVTYRIYKIERISDPEPTIIKKTKTPNHRKRRKGWE